MWVSVRVKTREGMRIGQMTMMMEKSYNLMKLHKVQNLQVPRLRKITLVGTKEKKQIQLLSNVNEGTATAIQGLAQYEGSLKVMKLVNSQSIAHRT